MSRGGGTARHLKRPSSRSRYDGPFVVQVHMRLAGPSPRCSTPHRLLAVSTAPESHPSWMCWEDVSL